MYQLQRLSQNDCILIAFNPCTLFERLSNGYHELYLSQGLTSDWKVS